MSLPRADIRKLLKDEFSRGIINAPMAMRKVNKISCGITLSNSFLVVVVEVNVAEKVSNLIRRYGALNDNQEPRVQLPGESLSPGKDEPFASPPRQHQIVLGERKNDFRFPNSKRFDQNFKNKYGLC